MIRGDNSSACIIRGLRNDQPGRLEETSGKRKFGFRECKINRNNQEVSSYLERGSV